MSKPVDRPPSYLRDHILIPLGIPVLVLAGVGFVIVNVSRVLLAVSKNAAVAVAIAVALVVLAGSAFAAARTKMSSRSLLGLLIVFCLLVGTAGAIGASVGERKITPHHEAEESPAPAPTRTGTASPTAGPPAGEATTTLVTKGFAFDKKEIALPAGKPVVVRLTNQDSTIHNFALYKDASAADVIFVGETFGGPGVTKDYAFTAPAAGSYFFRCDVHHSMTGTAKVS